MAKDKKKKLTKLDRAMAFQEAAHHCDQCGWFARLKDWQVKYSKSAMDDDPATLLLICECCGGEREIQTFQTADSQVQEKK